VVSSVMFFCYLITSEENKCCDEQGKDALVVQRATDAERATKDRLGGSLPIQLGGTERGGPLGVPRPRKHWTDRREGSAQRATRGSREPSVAGAF
jgi:hypothetical protein